MILQASKIDRSNVQISDCLGVCLDESLPGIHRDAHQHVKGAVGFCGVIHSHQQKGPVNRVHGRFPELGRVHLAQALVGLKPTLSGLAPRLLSGLSFSASL